MYIVFLALFVLLGLGIALQPGPIIAGIHVKQVRGSCPLNNWALSVLVVGMTLWGLNMATVEILARLTTYVVLVPLLETIVQWSAVCLAVLAILQLLRIIDISHGERNLQFYYDHSTEPIWLKRYMSDLSPLLGGDVTSNSVCMTWRYIVSHIVTILYMLVMPGRSLWPYMVGNLLCQWSFGSYGVYMSTAMGFGYIIGHIVFHYNESRLVTTFALIGRIITPLVVSGGLVYIVFHFYLDRLMI